MINHISSFLWLYILIAYCLDLIIGDPLWFPHPVRGIGWAIQQLEKALRRGKAERLSGCLLTLFIVGGTYSLATGVLYFAVRLHPYIGHALSVIILWTTLATKDLYVHSKQVYKPLAQRDLPTARRMLSRIVGRDTDKLDEPEVVRATVETIAENVVDGITAPLFYAILFGAPAALAYKAASTLDSMVGYKNERYKNFGWASARFDDIVNFIPARVTGILIPFVALCIGFDIRNSWRIFWRDRKKHPSPNSAHAEAAFAGALNVRLGGTSTYSGVPSHKEFLGDANRPLEINTIRRAQLLMFATSAMFLAFGLICSLCSPTTSSYGRWLISQNG
ncbi:cobalamin biosynthesis protein CobD [Candidatus Poribacteria bacterium]|nr:cobalamin biosynthesis protein CobD [Candidatus Poribacteria bacterium]